MPSMLQILSYQPLQTTMRQDKSLQQDYHVALVSCSISAQIADHKPKHGCPTQALDIK